MAQPSRARIRTTGTASSACGLCRSKERGILLGSHALIVLRLREAEAAVATAMTAAVSAAIQHSGGMITGAVRVMLVAPKSAARSAQHRRRVDSIGLHARRALEGHVAIAGAAFVAPRQTHIAVDCAAAHEVKTVNGVRQAVTTGCHRTGATRQQRDALLSADAASR